MLKKFLAMFLFAGFSLNAGISEIDANDYHHSGHSSHHHHHHSRGIRNYAVLANQSAVTTGEIIPWTSSTISAGAVPPAASAGDPISVDVLGNITLPIGVFLVEYTVRINKTPFDGTSTAVAQLQQTVSGVPTNIAQPAITTNTSIDGITAGVPESQTQITGVAIITVTSTSNNVIDLLVTLSGGDTIPAATGTDANAELVIIQLN